jgi:hypothetical protein
LIRRALSDIIYATSGSYQVRDDDLVHNHQRNVMKTLSKLILALFIIGGVLAPIGKSFADDKKPKAVKTSKSPETKPVKKAKKDDDKKKDASTSSAKKKSKTHDNDKTKGSAKNSDDAKDQVDKKSKGPNGETVYIGPKGGKYYMNKSGNKTYIKK